MLLVSTTGNRRLVARRCSLAARAGVRVGMTLAHARALLPAQGVIAEPYLPALEARSLRALAIWATRFSPIVSPDAPDGLLLDITGCPHLFGGEAAMAERIVCDLSALGFQARAAIAPTPGCAWAAARYAAPSPCIIEANEVRSLLLPMPLASLRLEPGILQALAEVGVTHVSHLLALPRKELAERFDSQVLQRVDQALGTGAAEVVEPVRTPPPMQLTRQLEGPTTQGEALALLTRELLQELAQKLLQAECGCRRLMLVLGRVDCPPQSITLELGQPSRNPRHWWTLLMPQLEKAHLGFGVESLTLTAQSLQRLPHPQAHAWNETGEGRSALQSAPQHGQSLAELVDVLAGRLGPGQITRLQRISVHLPEHQLRPKLATEDAALAVELTASDQGEAHSDGPSLLLAEPEPVGVEVEPSPAGLLPVSVTWRGNRHRILAAIGPQRIVPAWWMQATPPAARDYYKLQTDQGQWLWVYCLHEPSARWQLQGIWR